MNRNQPISKIIVNSNIFKYKIQSYLSLIDIYNFLQSDICAVYINKILIDKIHKQINKQFEKYFGDKFWAFIQAMEISEGIISGSCIFHAIHKEFVLANDIDIYFKNKYQFTIFVKHFEDNYDNIFYKNTGENVDENINENINENIDNNNYNNFIHINEIYMGNEYKIQCIILDNIEIKEYILNQYDFDISKNFIYFKNDTIFVELYSLNDVITKSTKISKLKCDLNKPKEYKLKKIYNRLDKYVTIKKVNFDINKSINAISNYYADYFENTYLSNVFVKEYLETNPFTMTIHGYNKHVILYKYECNANCLLKCINVEHYHTLNNDGKLLDREKDNTGIYNNTIEIIHINSSKLNIPDNIYVNKCCKTKKIKHNAYSMASYKGKYILIKKKMII
jgi:hypothetical protein